MLSSCAIVGFLHDTTSVREPGNLDARTWGYGDDANRGETCQSLSARWIARTHCVGKGSWPWLCVDVSLLSQVLLISQPLAHSWTCTPYGGKSCRSLPQRQFSGRNSIQEMREAPTCSEEFRCFLVWGQSADAVQSISPRKYPRIMGTSSALTPTPSG